MTVHWCDYRVIYGDTDGMGIVYYANYLRIFEMARSEFFRDLICTPMTMVRDDNYLIVVKAFVHYLSPAAYEDNLLVCTWIPEDRLKQATIQFNYLILEKETERRIVTGYTAHAMTTKDGKLKRMPKDFLKKISTLAEEDSPFDDLSAES
jgi:acyl-CoA thioester hydrolase